jgi:hypothetical protein
LAAAHPQEARYLLAEAGAIVVTLEQRLTPAEQLEYRQVLTLLGE